MYKFLYISQIVYNILNDLKYKSIGLGRRSYVFATMAVLALAVFAFPYSLADHETVQSDSRILFDMDSVESRGAGCSC